MSFTRLSLLAIFIISQSFAQKPSTPVKSSQSVSATPSFKPTTCYYRPGQHILKPGTNVTRYINQGNCESVKCNNEAEIEIQRCPPIDHMRSCAMKIYLKPPPFPDCCVVCDDEITRQFEERVNGVQ